ncbi:hypothetical protein Ahy_A05g021945 isoform A [Arachis hypogaea]|uniref:Uncharacterized protein n=1 Tax=Arachis hypogaea TaxID=3818 RepID=A0A445CZ56_ARAHY|nr:hypothetical protein Ahy_A05g021945 isoform A [Arachis hypogaea]
MTCLDASSLVQIKVDVIFELNIIQWGFPCIYLQLLIHSKLSFWNLLLGNGYGRGIRFLTSSNDVTQ